ncbi:MAG: 5-(carboxyamino)imidazole ribonucleotide synthase [Haloarculaceae archaeon]
MKLTSPGPTLGVVGGGQLGRMLGEAAGPLGVEVVVSDPTPDCPASAVVRDQVVGDFDDYETLHALGERADVLTYEIELADADALERVREETGTPVHPAPEALRTTQDKLREKETLADADIPVPAFRRVDSAADLRAAGEDLGWPVMLKAREGGYDGRGNLPVAGPDEAESALAAVGAGDGGALAEEMVDFARELAVVGVRGDGETDVFPVTETVHREEILRETVSPARTDPAVRDRARAVARDVLDVLDGRGVFGIELFERDAADGPSILVNEIAPRPHNSGHWTIEGCLTSQFAQHVRAVVGWPLGATDRRCPTVTANVLGDVDDPRPAELSGVERVLSTDGANLHWYGKREVRPLRKMGHVTVVDDDAGDASEPLATAQALRDGLTFR